MECQIPGGEPRIFPLVGHGKHVVVIHVNPVAIAAQQALGRRRGHGRIALQPLFHHVVIELLAPQQPGKGLALHHAGIVGQAERERNCRNRLLLRCDRETPDENRARAVRLKTNGSAALSIRRAPGRCDTAARLGARFIGVHGVQAALDQIAMKCVLDIRLPAVEAPQAHACCFRFR